MVFRPRTFPLLSRFTTPSGEKLVWTTFSTDQIDLNYGNPELLLDMIEVLLFYIEMGAQFIRLDAIAYLWKQLGTACIHLEQTHRIVQLFRAVFDEVAPWVIIITETNVPHRDNISYFGDGHNEAQMVYQFSLPPLVLDAFRRGDASHLAEWAYGLGDLRGNITFFNFLASHDGVGVLPAHGILSEQELVGLAGLVESRGGYVSYKATPKGDIPYELNISYFDAVTDSGETDDTRVQKFLASQTIMLSLVGIPGIYIHSLLGTPNFQEGVESTGIKRTINRKKLSLSEVESDLLKKDSIRSRVFRGYTELLKIRGSHKAFHPFGGQEVLSAKGGIFAVLRTSPDGLQKILCLINTGPESIIYEVEMSKLGLQKNQTLRNVITENKLRPDYSHDKVHIPVSGYQYLWLEII
jgi:sucrose phosphorylase